MKLLLLHGDPASGKYTVAKAVLKLVNGRLFDNHVAINFARSIYDFGHPGFWPLVFEVRYAALESAARMGEPLLVTTLSYVDPDDRGYLERYEAAMGPGAEILPVFLHCPEQELEKRIGSSDRAARGKLTSIDMLRNFIRRKPAAPIPRPGCMTIDTSVTAPEATARQIVDRFELHSLPESPFAFLEREYRRKAEETDAPGLQP